MPCCMDDADSTRGRILGRMTVVESGEGYCVRTPNRFVSKLKKTDLRARRFS